MRVQTAVRMMTVPVVLLTACGAGGPAGNGPATGGATSSGSHGGGKVYVANEEDGTISVLAEADGRVLAVVDLAEQHPDGRVSFTPHNVQGSPDGRTVWVTAPPRPTAVGHGHAGGEQAIIIDTATDAVVGRVDLGAEQHVAHVVMDAVSEFAYVSANEANAVIQVNMATRAVERRFDLGTGRGPHGMRLCNGLLYVANLAGNSMAVLDPVAGNIIEVPLGGMAVQTACVPSRGYVFVSLYDTREVVRYEMATGALTRIALPPETQGPIQLYATPDGNRLYVADQGLLLDRPSSNLLLALDVQAAQVVATVRVGEGAHGVIVSEDGHRVFVTNTADGTVSIIDTRVNQVTQVIPVGAAPNGITHWHGNGAMP